MSNIDHVHYFDLGGGGGFLLSPYVLWERLFIVVLARRPFPLLFSVELASLFKDPTISVGVIGRIIGGAMNLARPIKYSVQTRWTISVSFEWLLLLTGFRATESGVDRRVFGTFIIVSTLVLVASWLAVVVPGFGGASIAGAIASTSKPGILSRAKAGHKCSKGCHGLRLFLAKVSHEPLISDSLFKCREGFSVRTIHNLVLFN